MGFLGVLLFFSVILLILWNLGSIVFHILKYLWGEMNVMFFAVAPHNDQKSFLEKYFAYYNLLPERSQYIFRKRVAYFISSKNFIPRDMPRVSEEMKVLIAASAIKLTFGFTRVHLSHFVNILVYPDDYYSTINNRYHKGEVNPRLKAIVLSWKSFVEGYLEDDGRNLGLHEMAHALSLENQVNNVEYDFLNRELLAKWHSAAKHEIDKIRQGSSDFFRSYGAENKDEFFAVAVENFFERPQEFYDYDPELYKLLCKLLNQDMLALQSLKVA